jgi:hypothetical protein
MWLGWAELEIAHPTVKCTSIPTFLAFLRKQLNTDSRITASSPEMDNLTIRNVLQGALVMYYCVSQGSSSSRYYCLLPFAAGFNVQSNVLLLPEKVELAASSEIDTINTLADIRLCVFRFFSPSHSPYAYSRCHPIRHDNIEHDTSLSQGDYLNGTGDNFTFNSNFSTLTSSNPGVDY